MSAGARVIRTPDQRLRIFVSSTLKELAPERQAARSAIERLHLAPVMFELGARPHPPRELYRAYLEQSDIFVGLYWERYGWVAPDEAVSGLEDEYNLCPPDLPRLIYVKRPAPEREQRLRELLDRIRSDDRASYKDFESPEELGLLLESDLAILLAERFEVSRTARSAATAQPTEEAPPIAPGVSLPVHLTALVGRERDLSALQAVVEGGARLVTLIGPGGIGKSRLAIAAAARLSQDFPDGTVFVDLSPVHDPDGVPAAIAQAIGVRDTGDAPIAEKVITALADRRMLLVLDNFEQVLEAAPAVTALLAAAPGVRILVTSRSLLRVGGERSFEVRALASEAATALFVDRAHAVKPDFEITPDNAEAVDRICTVLDGVPLAIELAAARVRVLSPAELGRRLDRSLPLLVGGPRDLPQRQQTLRSTIEWSTRLLGAEERRLLNCLGVFEGGFTLEAAEFVWAGGGPDRGPDALAAISTLVDNSLVHQHESNDHPRFSMLGTVREYAQEQLAEHDLLERVRELHARYFLALGDRADPELEGAGQQAWVQRLGDDTDNLRAAERFLLDRRDWARAAHLAWKLYIYWWVAGLLGEVRGWMDEVLAADTRSGGPEEIDDLTRAIALYFTRAITFWQDPEGTVASGLAESAELFRREGDRPGAALALISLALAELASPDPDPAEADRTMETSRELFRSAGDRWGESMALVTLGRAALLRQQIEPAAERFEESLHLAIANGDELGVTIAQHHRGWARLLVGDVAGAAADFAACLALSSQLGHVEGVAYAFEGMVAVAALGGDAQRAALLLGASRALRERTGLHNLPAFTFHQLFVDRLIASGGGEGFDEDAARGRTLSVEEAIEVASAPPAPAAPSDAPSPRAEDAQ